MAVSSSAVNSPYMLQSSIGFEQYHFQQELGTHRPSYFQNYSPSPTRPHPQAVPGSPSRIQNYSQPQRIPPRLESRFQPPKPTHTNFYSGQGNGSLPCLLASDQESSLPRRLNTSEGPQRDRTRPSATTATTPNNKATRPRRYTKSSIVNAVMRRTQSEKPEAIPVQEPAASTQQQQQQAQTNPSSPTTPSSIFGTVWWKCRRIMRRRESPPSNRSSSPIGVYSHDEADDDHDKAGYESGADCNQKTTTLEPFPPIAGSSRRAVHTSHSLPPQTRPACSHAGPVSSSSLSSASSSRGHSACRPRGASSRRKTSSGPPGIGNVNSIRLPPPPLATYPSPTPAPPLFLTMPRLMDGSEPATRYKLPLTKRQERKARSFLPAARRKAHFSQEELAMILDRIEQWESLRAWGTGVEDVHGRGWEGI